MDGTGPGSRLPAPLRGLGGLILLLALAGAVAFAAIQLTGALDSEPGEVEPRQIFETVTEGPPEADPFAWDDSRLRDFSDRAAFGNSHPLYALSPGGVEATARRTARWGPQIRAAAQEERVSPQMMEAMVFLESAGRPEVIAGGSDPANASGLAQIVASTGIDFLGMDIDLERSRALTSEINAATARAADLRKRARKLRSKPRRQDRNRRKARALEFAAEEADLEVKVARRQRARIDPRFDPEAALRGMSRYLAIANERLGREDLAVTSYHMGIGNLSEVIRLYADAEDIEGSVAELVRSEDLSYAELHFGSSPLEQPDAWAKLDELADDSLTYYWRVLAAREILRLAREDPDELERLSRLHAKKATAEEVFHPVAQTRVFDDAEELADGLEAGELVPVPDRKRLGFRVGPQLGELTEQLGVERRLYRALRPEALATLTYMAAKVDAIAGGNRKPLTVTSAVRDRAYQAALTGRNVQATTGYSLHTTGWSFDILRDYDGKRQARAFQFVLDRLADLAVIDYAVEPMAIHVTVSEEAEVLLE